MPNVNNILEGNQFAWSLKGISDFEFAKINFNKSTEEMQVDLKQAYRIIILMKHMRVLEYKMHQESSIQ